MSHDRVRHIFTYGTLMSCIDGSLGAAERAALLRQARCLGAASIRGRMFDADPFPGVVLDGGAADRVHGELWQLPADARDLLAMLDRYEGCAPQCPEPQPYRRCKIRIRTPSARRVTAWMFVWAGSTAALPSIPDGRWHPRVQVDQARAA